MSPIENELDSLLGRIGILFDGIDKNLLVKKTKSGYVAIIQDKLQVSPFDESLLDERLSNFKITRFESETIIGIIQKLNEFLCCFYDSGAQK